MAEREDLWCAGPGIVDLPGPTAGSLDPLLRAMPDDELRRILESDPARVIAELAASESQRDALLRQVFDLRRGSWQVLCPIGPGSVIVDLEAGFGAVTRALARNAGLVIGLDDVRARLLVADALNRSQGVENVRLVWGDVRAVRNWPDAVADGVALGRQMGGVGGTDAAGRAERLDFLRSVRRVLRADGWVSLIAENGHELRTLAKRRRSAYPGIAGLTGLMQEAGFAEVSVYTVAPDAECGHTLVPFTRDGDFASALRAYGVRKKWKLALLGTALLRPFVPRDLLVVARVPGARRPAFLERDNGEARAIRRIYLNSGRASLWYQSRRDRAERILEVSMDDAATDALGRTAAIAAAWRGRDDTPAFFDGWRRGNADGRSWADRRNVAGTPLADAPDGAGEERLAAVCRMLRSFALIGGSVGLPAMDRCDVVRHFLHANANARARRDANVVERMQRVAEALRDRYPGGPPLLMHGDLTPNNVLVCGRRVEPIDWDLATPVDFPGYDVMNLLWYRHCGPQPEAGFWTRLVDECAAGRADPEAARWIREAYGNVDPVGALATFWLLRMARGTAFGDAWVAAHAATSLARAESWLARPA